MHTKTVRQQGNKPTWWRVRFQAKHRINLVVIYNRLDECCDQRIDGAQVYAGSHKCGTIRFIEKHSVYYVDCGGVQADFVKVMHPKELLNLAEVQVFGKWSGRELSYVDR